MYIRIMAKMKKKKITLENLVALTQKGFLELGEKIDGVEGQIEKMGKRMNNLEDGQEEIKLRLDNVAYRFELVELQKRIDLLEKKVLPKAKRSDIMK